jgi:NAD+ kinase
VRALNEVFVGESLSSKVSNCEMEIDGNPAFKIKCSGITISTGTGSTSWSFNINKLTSPCVTSLVKIINDETGSKIPADASVIQRITRKFNDSLIFDPSKLQMAYTIRDPIVFRTGYDGNPRGFADKIRIRSKMFDACVVLDGGLSYKFNDGAIATFEIREDDALKTVELQ